MEINNKILVQESSKLGMDYWLLIEKLLSAHLLSGLPGRLRPRVTLTLACFMRRSLDARVTWLSHAVRLVLTNSAILCTLVCCLMSWFLTLSSLDLPAMALRACISVVLISCFVFAFSARASAPYIITGRTIVLYIRVLLSMLMYLFLHIASFR